MEEQEEERKRVEEEQERLRVSGQEKDIWLVVLLEQLLPPCSQQRAALVTALQSPGPAPPPFQLSSLCLAVQTAPPAKRLVSEVEVRLGAWSMSPTPAWEPGACQHIPEYRDHASIFPGEGSVPASAWVRGASQNLLGWREHASICLGGGSMPESAWVVGACQHLTW